MVSSDAPDASHQLHHRAAHSATHHYAPQSHTHDSTEASCHNTTRIASTAPISAESSPPVLRHFYCIANSFVVVLHISRLFVCAFFCCNYLRLHPYHVEVFQWYCLSHCGFTWFLYALVNESIRRGFRQVTLVSRLVTCSRYLVKNHGDYSVVLCNPSCRTQAASCARFSFPMVCKQLCVKSYDSQTSVV